MSSKSRCLDRYDIAMPGLLFTREQLILEPKNRKSENKRSPREGPAWAKVTAALTTKGKVFKSVPSLLWRHVY